MIRNGSRVKIHYTLKVDNQVLESTSGKEPLSFVWGTGEVFPGLEAELLGRRAGDRTSFDLPPEKGFGPAHPEAIQKVPKAVLDLAADLEPGQTVSGHIAGDAFRGTVVAIGDHDITLDLNHPLAGKTLHFDVEVMEVSP